MPNGAPPLEPSQTLPDPAHDAAPIEIGGAVPTIVHAALLLCTLGARPAPALRLEPAAGPTDAARAAPRRLLLASLRLSPDASAASEPPRPATLQAWGRGLRLGTATALLAATALGTMTAINQPTRFGDGRCITGHPLLGTDYGCNKGLSTLHGVSGVASATLYTANGVLRLARPESRGSVAEGAMPSYGFLSWVHLGGIVVQPLIGLIAAYPQVIGLSRTAPTDPFPRNLRTAHIVIGYITTAAFLTTVALEW